MKEIEDYTAAKAAIASEQAAADDAARTAFEAAEALESARASAQMAADALEVAKRASGYDTARKVLLERLAAIEAKGDKVDVDLQELATIKAALEGS